MTSPGSIIVAHTRTFRQVYSSIGTSRKQIDFEPPKKIERGRVRAKGRVLCLLRMRKSSREKRDEEDEKKRNEALVTAKATVLLSLMRKNSENNNIHTHNHIRYIDKR